MPSDDSEDAPAVPDAAAVGSDVADSEDAPVVPGAAADGSDVAADAPRPMTSKFKSPVTFDRVT